MVIYQPAVAEGYEWVTCVDDRDYERLLNFDGSSQSAGWSPMRLRRVVEDEGQRFRPSDFPWLGAHVLVMRQKAVESLRGVTTGNGEVLPAVATDGTALFMLNVTRVLDALDDEKSKIIRFPPTNEILNITSPFFRSDVIQGVDVFRLPHRASPTFVSDRFVQTVRAAQLTGLAFKKVWTAETVN